MPASLELRLTGGAANADPDASLGGTRSSTLLGAGLHNLFDLVSVDEAANGDDEYRALALYNSGDAAATSVSLYMETETTSADSQIDMASEGVDPAAPLTAADESDSTAQLSGLTFLHYNSGSKLALPDIPAGSECRIWLKRSISVGAGNISGDAGTIRAEFA